MVGSKKLDRPRAGLRAAAAALAVLILSGLAATEAAAQRRPGPNQREQQQQQVPEARTEKTFPLGASWTLISLNGKPAIDRRVTLQVDGNLRGTGFGGCNTFSATAYPLREQGFAVGPMAVTKRACDKGAMDFERSYLLALRSANKWDLVEGRLVLKSNSGEIRFDRGL